MATTAGSLRDRLQFESQKRVADGAGNFRSDEWEVQFVEKAEVKARVGGEAVIAERLQGRQPIEITVRYAFNTTRIETDWRAVDCRTGTVYQIKSPPVDRERRRQWLTMAAESGIAA